MATSKIIWSAVLIVGIVLIAVSLFRGGGTVQMPEETESPILTEPPANTAEPTTNNIPNTDPTETPGGDFPFDVEDNPNLGNLSPATCQLSGALEFIAQDRFIDRDGNIAYQNIDSDARHINWSITPEVDASIGPNLFAGLPVPDGEKRIIMSFNEIPKADKYTLAAHVTYAQRVDGELKILEAECSGKTDVIINF